jgi:hypothetical protein
MLTFIAATSGCGTGDSGVGLLTSCVSNPTPASDQASIFSVIRGVERAYRGIKRCVRLSLYVPKERRWLIAELEAEARATGRAKNQIVLDALAAYLQQQKRRGQVRARQV